MINQLYLIYKIPIKQAVIGVAFLEKITEFLYLIHLELVIFQKIFMEYMKILILLQIYIESNISIQIYVDYIVHYFVYIKLIVTRVGAI